MKHTVETDIAIIGGGVAGLWLLHRVRQMGFSAVLFETATLGGGQTHKAQGIIHGGTKYALQGSITKAAEAISSMPALWQKCLEGRGEIDLSHVPVLSHHQYLWTTGALASKFAGYFAGLALRGNVKLLDKTSFPLIFQNPQFKGQVYSLDEMVLDVHALVRELVRPNQDAIFKIDSLDAEQVHLDEKGAIESFELRAAPLLPLELKAQKYIFTAGSGNEFLIKKLRHKELRMQRRPLRMVIVKHDFPYDLYAHCLGFGSTPRLTITTHQAQDGKTVWYIGGQISEEGVKRSDEEQSKIARDELQALFPWLDFSKAEIKSFMVDRAEASQPGGRRPDSCHVESIQNCMIAWPTKLAFAPLLANKIVTMLTEEHMTPGKSHLRELRAWPIPPLAVPIWDQL